MTFPDAQQAPCVSQTNRTHSDSNISDSVKILNKFVEIMSAENVKAVPEKGFFNKN